MPHTENTANACTNGHGNGHNEHGITVNVEELAVSPNLPAQVPGLLDEIAAFGKQYLGVEPQARLKFLETARSLVYALETPRVVIIRHCWAEDLPEVISAVKDLHPSIEITAHDFFTEQPVKAARAYYLHSVLHDWPNDLCSKILANLVAAMKPGYSKLLVNENVIPNTAAYWETTSLDLIMMQLGSGERTERHWGSLLESAGLRIVRIWTAHGGVESLIECELA